MATIFADASGFHGAHRKTVDSTQRGGVDINRHEWLPHTNRGIVYKYGGDIVKFAGDAVSCIFPPGGINGSLPPGIGAATIRASRCAMELHNRIDGFVAWQDEVRPYDALAARWRGVRSRDDAPSRHAAVRVCCRIGPPCCSRASPSRLPKRDRSASRRRFGQSSRLLAHTVCLCFSSRRALAVVDAQATDVILSSLKQLSSSRPVSVLSGAADAGAQLAPQKP